MDAGMFDGVVAVNTSGWQTLVAVDRVPALYDHYMMNASLVDEVDLGGDGRYFFAAASHAESAWPGVVVSIST